MLKIDIHALHGNYFFIYVTAILQLEIKIIN